MGRLKRKTKYIVFFGLSFLLVGAILEVLVLVYTHTSYVRELHTSSLNTLNRTLTEKNEAIEDYLSSIERDVGVLAKALEIQSILDSQTFFDKSAIVRDVDRRARIVVKEVENYILAHPNMTLKELQQSEEFRDIATQPVGKEGYSVLVDYEKEIIRFHIFEDFIGLYLGDDTIRDTLPEIYALQKETRNNKEVFGFYDWKEPDERIQRKYLHSSRIDVRTADNVGLTVATTAYVNDYRIVREVSPIFEAYVDMFKKDFAYSNIVLINPEGYVIYTAEEIPLLGGNLTWPVNKESGLARNYIRALRENEISFFGPFIGVYGDIYPSLSIMAPVFSNRGTVEEELLGFVAIVDTMDSIFAITEERTYLSDTGETYLVSEDDLLVSPLRLRDLDIFVQSVKSEHANDCFTETPEEHHADNHSETFLNYRGDVVLGTHNFIQNARWCLLTEIEYEEAVVLPARKQTEGKIPLFLAVLGLLTLTGSNVGWFMYARKKKQT